MACCLSLLLVTIVVLVNFVLFTSAVYHFNVSENKGILTLDKYDIVPENLKEKYFKGSEQRPLSGDLRLGKPQLGDILYQRLIHVENNEQSPVVFPMEVSIKGGKAIHHVSVLHQPGSTGAANIKPKALGPSRFRFNVEINFNTRLYLRILVAAR